MLVILSAAVVGCLLIGCVSASAADADSSYVVSAEDTRAKFYGTALTGLTEQTIQRGGATIGVQLQVGYLKFNASLTSVEILTALKESIQPEVRSNASCWWSLRDSIFLSSAATATISNHGRSLKVRFGAVPAYNCTVLETVKIVVPSALIGDNARGRDLIGPEFYIVHNGRLQLEADDPLIATVPATLTVIFGDFKELFNGFRLVEGTTCAGADAKLNGKPVLDAEAETISFVPLLGGMLSLCYSPLPPNAVAGGATVPQITADAFISVAGPDGFSADPPAPRAESAFEVTIYGNSLTSEDLVTLSAGDCADIALSEDLPDVTLKSQTRTAATLTAQDDGVMNVCYYRAGGAGFTKVGSISVQRRVELVVDGDAPLVISSEETIVERNARIDFLTIEGGVFYLDHYQLNVTHFMWVQGSINGRGIISMRGPNSHILNGPEPKMIQSVVRNFGTLTVDLHQLFFDETGYLENYGTLVIKVNSSESSTALLHGPADQRLRLLNGPSGKLRIVSDAEKCRLDVRVVFENRGELSVAPKCEVHFSRMNAEHGASFTLGSSATAMIVSGSWRSSAANLLEQSRLGFLQGRTSLRGVHVSGHQSRLDFAEGVFEIDQITVDGQINVLFFGNKPSHITFGGHNRFGSQSVLAMRDAVLESSFSTAHIDVDGRFLCHISSLTFGDNLVIEAKLQSVLFGTGNAGESAELVPQQMPRNSSFIIPPNATVVILDTGLGVGVGANASSALGPQMCSTYVVVPMFVKSEGHIFLRGCAMLPFGGSHSGVVGGGSVEELESLVQYALCRNALSQTEVCIPVFPSDNESSLALGGEHVLMLPAPSSATSSAAPTPSHVPALSVTHLRTMPQSTFTARTPLEIVAARGLLVEGQFQLAEGGRIQSPLLTVRGILTARADAPTILEGSLFVEGSLDLEVSTDTCSFPLTVLDTMRLADKAKLQCQQVLNVSSGSSAALVRTRHMEGSMYLDPTSCVSASMSLALLETGPTRSSSGDELPKSIGLQVDHRQEYPSRWVKAAASAVILLVGLAFLLLHLWRQAITVSIRELAANTEVPAHLSWTEFCAFPSNYLALATMWAEVLMLSAPAFHSLLPLPSMGHLTTSAHWLLFGGDASSNYHVEASTLCIAIGCWALAWIPLAGNKFSSVLKTLLHNRENNFQRQAVRCLFQFHTFMSAAAIALFIPVISILSQVVACNTILVDEPRCESMKDLLYPSLISWALFHYLAPYAPSCRAFPFGHPPYRRELDLRYKRVYTYLICALYFVEVCLWKVFPSHPTQLLLTVIILQLSVFVLTLWSNPCVYANINRVKAVANLLPVWAMICALVQVMRHGTDQPEFICTAADSVFVAMLCSGWAALLLLAIFLSKNLNRAAGEGDLLRCESSSAVHLSAIKDTQKKLEYLRLELYNTGNSRERDRIGDEISGERLRQLHLLSEYRRRKERIALPYYLGATVGSALLEDTSSFADYEEGSTPLGDVSMKTFGKQLGSPASPPQAIAVRTDGDLSFEQMENFIQGPPLGKGSYGAVFMGMLPDGKLVAVKEVEISRKHKKEQLAGLKKEINVLKTLVHPNIIRYFGAHSTGRYMRVFMEFAVGGSLTSLVRKFDQLSEPLARRYIHQVLCGLDYLHGKHVVHRDIKGENILIDGQGVAKLADFGCSKGLSDIANKSREGCDSLVGSPYWMAPEVIRSEAYGTKADIWSVGCTVVEVLNGGNPPWYEKFDNVYTAMYYIGTTTDLPSNIPDTVSESCKAFLAQCFERDPAKRASAAELLQHRWITEAFAPAATAEARPPEPPLPPRQWSDMFDPENIASTIASERGHSGDEQDHDTLGRMETDSLRFLRGATETSVGPVSERSNPSTDSDERRRRAE